MKQKALLLFMTLVLTTNVFAQRKEVKTGVISGKIIDEEENTSLPGAAVLLDGGNKYTISGQHGDYEFLNVPEGTYKISVSYMGYATQEKEVTLSSGAFLEIPFHLSSDSEDLEAILIVGERLKGQAKALNQQKNKTNISNIISSDQVGRFPDANVGDALKRVPGITMQNDQGEARNIIIRGLAPNLNSVTLNGDRIPSAEGDNRNVQMDLIPSDMISTIEVNKTLTPDMDADAIGGSVNLITRASPNGERISATVAGGFNPIRDKGNYTAGFVYGNRFADSKLGMVLSGSYNNNNLGSDNVEAVWDKDDSGKSYMSQYQIRKYDVQRVRRSFAAAFDYKFNQNHSIYANAIYNWRDDRENRYRATYRGLKEVLDANNEVVGYTGEIRRETKGGINNSRNKNTRLEDQRIQNYALGGEHLLGSTLDMDWSFNYATASEDRPNERYIDYNAKDVFMIQNISNPEKPFMDAPQASLSDFGLRNITENHNYTDESEYGAKINFRTPFSVIEDEKGRLRFGLRMRLKDKQRDNVFYKYSPVGNFASFEEADPLYYNGDGFQAGSQYTPGHFVSNDFLGNLDLKNSALFKEKLDPSEYLAQNFKAREQVYAGYIRWDQDFNHRLSMIVGARLEHTKIDYKGNYVMDEEDLIGEVNNKNDYTNILPSLSFRYVNDTDLVLRAAFSTALARPDYYALAPYVSVMSDDTHVAAGNPNLKATYAYNFDVMAEQYFKSVGILSAGVFYKNLNDFIYTYSNKKYTQDMFASDFPNQANPIPNAEEWSFVQQKNGDNVNLFGFEVAVQRQLDFIPGAFWKGLGVYVNYTYTHSEAKGIANEDGDMRTNIKLPGTAPHMFNSSLSWENNRFSARVSLNYTSDYVDELGGNEFEDSYYDKQLFLDANASYKITPQWRVFAEANNLTNQPLRYYQGVKQQTMQMEYYQPRFNLGVKFDF